MAEKNSKEARIDQVLILFLFALFLLISPLRNYWSGATSPWYTPYLVWGIIIFVAFLLYRRKA